MIEQLKEYLNKDKVSYIHVIDLLDRNYKLEYASKGGFLIYDLDFNFTYISFEDEKEMEKVLNGKHFDNYLAYDQMITDYYGHTGKTIDLYQYAYTSDRRFDLNGYDIRTLTLNDSKMIHDNYKSLDPTEDMDNHLRKGEMIGLYVNGEIAGFIGRHTEGCMGQLLVFDKFRRKGYATILEKAMINKLLDEGQRVFYEVISTNSASLALQEKLGTTKGKKVIHWYQG